MAWRTINPRYTSKSEAIKQARILLRKHGNRPDGKPRMKCKIEAAKDLGGMMTYTIMLARR